MNKTLPALPGKAPALPPGAFEFRYTAQDGAQHRVPLAGAAVVRFADTQPTRRIRTRKGQRHLPGRWWSATDGRHIGYEAGRFLQPASAYSHAGHHHNGTPRITEGRLIAERQTATRFRRDRRAPFIPSP